MNDKLSRIKTSVFCALYSLVYTFCLYKNYSGVTFPFFAAATLCFFGYYMKEQGLTMKKYSFFIMTAIMLLAANVCLTASPYLAALDRVFIFVLFFTLFLHNIYDDKTWDVSRYTAAMLTMICSLIVYLPAPFKDWVIMAKERKEGEADVPAGKGNIKYVLIGLAISIPLLLIVLPLLITSDAVFSDTMKRFFDFDIDENIIGIAFMLIVIFFVGYAMVKRLGDRVKGLDEPVKDKRTKSPVVAITISSVLMVFYLLYCGIQIIYLFMGYGTLPEGYTYAEYVHEGFYQLVFVCIINLILVLLCRKFSRDNAVLKVMLTLISVCTFIMIFSSAYRMFLYVGAYGLTYLRLFVFWSLTVIGLAMTGTVIYIFAPGMPFYKYSLAVLSCTWILFAYMLPDYQIARYNLTHAEGYDKYYMVYNLSPDAAPAMERYSHDEELIAEYLRNTVPSKFKSGIRNFNYSKWMALRIAADHDISLQQ